LQPTNAPVIIYWSDIAQVRSQLNARSLGRNNFIARLCAPQYVARLIVPASGSI
jgi:hypothetical protein